jgi:hypothetical protein
VLARNQDALANIKVSYSEADVQINQENCIYDAIEYEYGIPNKNGQERELKRGDSRRENQGCSKDQIPFSHHGRMGQEQARKHSGQHITNGNAVLGPLLELGGGVKSTALN